MKYEFKATYIGILYSMKQVSMCMHVCVFVSARAGLGHLERDSEGERKRARVFALITDYNFRTLTCSVVFCNHA